jgi:hypothetical protein
MKINVRALNECLGIEGPDWIEDNFDDYIEYVFCRPPTAFKKGHQTNKGRPTSELQKRKARENALKRNENYKGSNNPRAKTWRIVYENGKEIIISGLQRWAVNNGYSTSGIKKIAYGEWKRYKDLVTVEEVAHRPSQTAQETL